jgi:hypothetical protein
MQPTLYQQLILEATIDGSVIRGTLTAPTGKQRDFHGWLELNTALEGMLHAGAGRAPNNHQTAGPRHGPPPTQSRP